MNMSIVIPFHRDDDLLLEALKSVIADLEEGDEIILIDDSPSESIKLQERIPELKAMNGAQVDILQFRNAGHGVVDARNLGVQIASSKIVSFLDSDDLWIKGRRNRHLSQLERFPELPGVASTVIYVCSHGKNVGKSWLPKMTSCLEKLWRFNVASSTLPRLRTSAVSLRRDVFLEAGAFLHQESLAEDWGLWVRIQRLKGQFIFDPEPGAIYRQHPKQLSHTLKGDALRFARSISIREALKISADIRASLRHKRFAKAISRSGFIGILLGDNKLSFVDAIKDLRPELIVLAVIIGLTNRMWKVDVCRKCNNLRKETGNS
jgi:glycosyltransferase involved in cell wall biosynthesis